MSDDSAADRGRATEYHCDDCPGYCCTSAFDEVYVTYRDLDRLSEHLSLSRAQVETLFIRDSADAPGERTLARKPDPLLGASACVFFDTTERRCAVYEGRPDACRDFPSGQRCGFFDALGFFRQYCADPLALISITKRETAWASLAYRHDLAHDHPRYADIYE